MSGAEQGSVEVGEQPEVKLTKRPKIRICKASPAVQHDDKSSSAFVPSFKHPTNLIPTSTTFDERPTTDGPSSHNIISSSRGNNDSVPPKKDQLGLQFLSIYNQNIVMVNNTLVNVQTTMQLKLESLPSNPNCCIFKVPEYIMKGKEDYYRPSVISIGPVFYGDPRLETMQDLKWIYLNCFLQHPGNACQSLEPYIRAVTESESLIRSCYQETTRGITNDKFVEMIVLDACFLIYLFLVESKSDKCPSCESKSDKCPSCDARKPDLDHKIRVLMVCFRKDLFLLENQLPFLVLKDIYRIAFGNQQLSVTELALEFIRKFCGIPGRQGIKSIVENNPEGIMDKTSSYLHLVDLRRACFCEPFYRRQQVEGEKSSSFQHTVDLRRLCCGEPFCNRQQVEGEQPRHKFLTAKHLSAAGVKFNKSNSENLLDITFDEHNGELKIPKLTLDDYTEPVMRNILFYEQCIFSVNWHFVDYVYFLDRLIDTVEDIQVLQKNDILDNQLGSDEDAVDLFNKLCKNMTYSKDENFTFLKVSRGLTAYASKPWHRWKVIFWRKYFNHPWAIISVIYAIILLILTIAQTIGGFTSK